MQWSSSSKSNQQQSRVSCRLAGQKGNIDKGINIERMERRPTVMSESTNWERRRRNRGIGWGTGFVCALVLMSCWLSDEMPSVTAAGRVWPHASNNFKRVGAHEMGILEISDTFTGDQWTLSTRLWWEPKPCGGLFFLRIIPRKKIRPVVFAFLKWCLKNSGLLIKVVKSDWACFPHWPSLLVLREMTRCWHHSLVQRLALYSFLILLASMTLAHEIIILWHIKEHFVYWVFVKKLFFFHHMASNIVHKRG